LDAVELVHVNYPISLPVHDLGANAALHSKTRFELFAQSRFQRD